MWKTLQEKISNLVLNIFQHDQLVWRWSTSGMFTVHYFYAWLDYGGVPNNTFITIWQAKIPLKIKIFLWLVKKNKILTKVNLAKRGWQGSVDCPFCGLAESTNHLFVTCQFASQL